MLLKQLVRNNTKAIYKPQLGKGQLGTAAYMSSMVCDLITNIDWASQIIVLAGAGILTASGLKDFRGKDGMYHDNATKEDMSLPQLKEPEECKEQLRRLTDFVLQKAEPNITHQFCA
ncbi:hypothetical protein HDU77_011358 [Chytriomyces hyalinus]|nr:hypothetical protein HDU77_011358 [Chytriomyces hyalinus]